MREKISQVGLSLCSRVCITIHMGNFPTTVIFIPSAVFERRADMPNSLSRLIEMAKAVKINDAQREEQRRSFVYGNTAVENEQITREMVNRKADALREK